MVVEPKQCLPTLVMEDTLLKLMLLFCHVVLADRKVVVAAPKVVEVLVVVVMVLVAQVAEGNIQLSI
jgi:hypothetical protein